MRLATLSYTPLVAALLLTGCVTTQTHDSKVAASLSVAKTGQIDEAIKQVEAQTQGSNKADLLLNLEKGELMRIGKRYKDSLDAFDVADTKVKIWEETAKSAPQKLMGQIGATIMGDASRDYEGQDYEKVMLTTRMAMDRLNLGDLDTARVDIKRTHEREAVIAEFRAKETAEAEKEAKDKGVASTGKELNGYPVETLNDPEVLKLKNGYQNALSHYLAGFVYEALNEPGLAAPGYRKAIELRPDLPVLEDGLKGLDQRTSFRRKKGVTDVLFVVEAGNSPARQSKKIAFPVPTGRGLVTVSFAFPVIYPDPNAPVLNNIRVGDQVLPTALVTDFNVMARKALKDELPGIYTRAAIRAVTKALVQDQVNKKFGALAGLAANVAVAATESPADDRMWRSLPDRVFVARAFLPPGDYNVNFGNGGEATKVTVDGRYMVVPVRIYQNKTYMGDMAKFGSVTPVAQLQAEPEAAAEAPKTGKSKPAAKAKTVTKTTATSTTSTTSTKSN
ncbi:COG3014 family protein [Undibacterium sp. JH2W]|uniref:COG3014 family protein n=1 Tax=Undibacterium sp. JH2W TaxID=3413037 RepID=UPI003BF34DC9